MSHHRFSSSLLYSSPPHSVHLLILTLSIYTLCFLALLEKQCIHNSCFKDLFCVHEYWLVSTDDLITWSEREQSALFSLLFTVPLFTYAYVPHWFCFNLNGKNRSEYCLQLRLGIVLQLLLQPGEINGRMVTLDKCLYQQSISQQSFKQPLSPKISNFWNVQVKFVTCLNKNKAMLSRSL